MERKTRPAGEGRLRVLYVVTAAGFGGAPAHVLSLMRADRERDFEVALAAFPEPRLWREAGKLGAALFPVPAFGARAAAPWKDAFALGPVRRAIREFRPDVLSAHSTKAGFAARMAAWLERRERPVVIFTAHGWAFGPARPGLGSLALARAERLSARVTDRIICVSRYDHELALRHRVAPEEKMTVIHNGVDPAPFEAARARREETRKSLARELGVPGLEGGVWAAWAGRLEHPKDPVEAMRAWALLSSSRGEARKGGGFHELKEEGLPGSPDAPSVPTFLFFVGQGPLRGEAERVARREGLGGRVFFLGEREDVPEILAASDLFLLTSRHEGLPLTVIEAMMAGLPVVASHVGGVPELVEEGATGFLIPPGDLPALARALRELVADGGLRRRLGEAGRKKALSEFTRERMVRETHKVYFEELFRRAREEEGLPKRKREREGEGEREKPGGWKI